MQKVFISYSHKDETLKDQLVKHLKVLEMEGFYCAWDDRKITLGADWFTEIETALNEAQVIIMMISADFLTSEFIREHEVPRILERRREEGITVIPLIVKPCAWRSAEWLSSIQAAPKDGKPLSSFQPHEIDEELATLAETISKLVGTPNKKAGKGPFILPVLDVPTFTGRIEQLEQLQNVLIDKKGEKISSIVGLSGSGGIGKTALACHFATEYKDNFSDGIIGLRVDDRDVNQVAREMAGYIGHEIGEEDPRPAASIMQELFAHRSMLLIFDNAEATSVRELRPGGNNCAVIVTSRDRSLSVKINVPDDARIHLPELPENEAVELLERLMGPERVAAEPGAAKEITKLAGYWPLALEIVGKQLKMRTPWKLADYARRFRDEREQLKKFTFGDEKELNVETSLSLSLKDLEEEAVRFFASLGVCAQDGFSVRGAVAAAGYEEETAEDLLQKLFELSLLNRVHELSHRYVFHPLIRLFARKKAKELDSLGIAAQRHADFFINLVKLDQMNPTEKANVIVEEMNDILLAGHWLVSQEKTDYDFLKILQPYFESHGFWQEAANLMAGFLELAKRVNNKYSIVKFGTEEAKYLLLLSKIFEAEEKLKVLESVISEIEEESERYDSQAEWLISMGRVLQRRGKFIDAVNAFEKCYELEIRQNNEFGQAKVLNSLGGVLQRLGRFDEAVVAFEKGYGIIAKLGDERGIAMVQNSLGGVLQRLGKFDEAVSAFEKSYELETKLGNERGQAMVQNSLGGVLQRLGKFKDAAEAFQKSIELGELLEDKRHIAMAQNSFGGVLQRMGKFSEAAEAFEKSYELEIQLNNERGQAMVQNSLGGVLQRLGKFDEAVAAFEKSYEISGKLGDERSIAMVQNSFGCLWQRMKKFDQAIAAFERSYSLSMKLSDDIGQAMASTSLGEIFLSLNDNKKAISHLFRGFEINEKLKNKHGLNKVTPSLVRALLKANRKDDAIDCYQRAIAIAPKDKKILALKNEIFTEDAPKETGTVKFFKPNKRGIRFGFIVPEDNGENIYFNEKNVHPDDLPKLAGGAKVRFRKRHGAQSPVALDIRLL